MSHINLENRMERQEIDKGIRKLMVEIEGEEMRERIMHLKEKVDLLYTLSYKVIDTIRTVFGVVRTCSPSSNLKKQTR
jgi:septation ring formation regulator EzrA